MTPFTSQLSSLDLLFPNRQMNQAHVTAPACLIFYPAFKTPHDHSLTTRSNHTPTKELCIKQGLFSLALAPVRLFASSSTIKTDINSMHKQTRQLPTKVLLKIIRAVDDDIATLSAMSRASPLFKNMVAYSLSRREGRHVRSIKFPTVQLCFNQENKWFGILDLQVESISSAGKCVMKPAQNKGLDFHSSAFLSAPTLNHVRVNSVPIPFSSSNRKVIMKEGEASMSLCTDSKIESDLFSRLTRNKYDVSVDATLSYKITSASEGNKRQRHFTITQFECDVGFLHHIPEPKVVRQRSIATSRGPPPSYEQLPSYEVACMSPRVIV